MGKESLNQPIMPKQHLITMLWLILDTFKHQRGGHLQKNHLGKLMVITHTSVVLTQSNFFS